MTIPCSSRNAIILGVVGHYAGLIYVIWIYVITFMILAFTAKMLNRFVESDTLPLIEELPPYRKPIMKNLMVKAWLRMADFAYLVIPLLIVGGMFYSLPQHYDLINPFVKFFDILTVKWLDLPRKAIIPIIYGFLQKDLVPAMLSNALGTSDFSFIMTNHQHDESSTLYIRFSNHPSDSVHNSAWYAYEGIWPKKINSCVDFELLVWDVLEWHHKQVAAYVSEFSSMKP